jgi:hypothetical protein
MSKNTIIVSPPFLDTILVSVPNYKYHSLQLIAYGAWNCHFHNEQNTNTNVATTVMAKTITTTRGEVIPTLYCRPKCTYCTSNDHQAHDRLPLGTEKIKTGSRKLKYLENNLPQCHSIHHKSHMAGFGNGKLVSNCLSRAMMRTDL